MTAYQFLGFLAVFLIFVIALWKQSGVLFIIAALAILLLGMLGRLETWINIVLFGLAAIGLVVGVIKLVKGEF